MGIDSEALQNLVTNRLEGTFNADFSANTLALTAAIDGTVIAIVGAAGTIARSTIEQLIPLKPRELILIDINENGLTELIRDLRIRWDEKVLPELTPILMDVTSGLFELLFASRGDISAILNFSAVKHVRSERDEFSLLRMFDVNVLATLRMAHAVETYSPDCRLFSVSTDKAANPVNFMGASKRLMEGVLFDNPQIRASSARFANVAFSQGSLLEAWLKRIELGQPMPVPMETKRFFISMEEAGQLCTLAAFGIPNGSIAIPNFSDAVDLQSLEDVAMRILSKFGKTPKFAFEEATAKDLMLTQPKDSETQIVLLTRLDTEGEKPFEEFVGVGDIVEKSNLGAVHCLRPSAMNSGALSEFLSWLSKSVSSPGRNFNKSKMREEVARVIPNANWSISKSKLDDRI